MSMFPDLKAIFSPADEAREAGHAKKQESKVLLLVLHGEGQVLTWMAGIDMAEFVSSEHGPEGGEFDAADVDFEVPLDGLYIGEFHHVDEGPSDWGSPYRETSLGIRKLRPATAAEWESHRRGEFPWEPLEGSMFYVKEETP